MHCMKVFLSAFIGIMMVSALELQYSDWRRVYIFGAAEYPQMAGQQMQLFDSARNEIAERDIKIIKVPANDPLFSAYRVNKPAFTIILIGKDGGEKYRTNKILLPEKLFAIIDAMPMRRAEMRRKN